MTYHFVKTTIFATFCLAGPLYADGALVTTPSQPAAQHHGHCSDNVAFLSEYCAELRHAELARIRDCMGAEPATSQGYRARYLLCTAPINRAVESPAG